MRITAAYLKKWLQKEFDRLEIDLTVKECYHTKLRSQDYENGAAIYILKVDEEGSDHTATVFCSYNRYEIEKMLLNGYIMYWKPKHYQWIDGSEIEFRKK